LEQQNSKGQSPTTTAVVEQTINKIASGAEDSEDMRSYSRRLIKKFDLDNDGVITL
jgi:hypothetical protein